MLGIMLVDDEKQVFEKMEEILKEESLFQILTSCLNGISALKTVEELNPDVLIADVIIPGMSGFDLVKKIKIIKPNMPIILMSEDPSYAVKAYDIGISGFLLKPLAKEKVQKTLHRLLGV